MTIFNNLSLHCCTNLGKIFKIGLVNFTKMYDIIKTSSIYVLPRTCIIENYFRLQCLIVEIKFNILPKSKNSLKNLIASCFSNGVYKRLWKNGTILGVPALVTHSNGCPKHVNIFRPTEP